MGGLFSVEDILDPQFLSEAYKEVATSQLSNPLLDFYGKSPKPYTGDTIEMTYFVADKEPAPVNAKGSPARTQTPRGAKKYYHTPIHVFNELTIPLASIVNMRQPESQMVDSKGMQELQRQFELFGGRQQLTKAVALSKALVDGVVYVDPNGAILESSSGAAVTINLQVPAGHKSQLNYNGGGDIIAAAWDVAGTKILTQLDNLRAAAEAENAEVPRHIWLPTAAKAWFRENTEIKAFIQGGGASPEYVDKALQGSFMDLGGFTFHWFDGTYTAADGTTKPFIPATKAIITPDLGNWFRHYETDELVPTQTGIFDNLQSAMGATTQIFGDFAYAALSHNPPKLSLFLGTNFLFAFANVKSVWMPTIDF